jgi:5-methylcytosine-specific restriction protein B
MVATLSFTWIPFYTELADKLLDYKDNRRELYKILAEVYASTGVTNHFTKFGDVDPFSIFASFNYTDKSSKKKKRLAVMAAFKEKFHIQATVPTDFDGVPEMSPYKIRFFDGNSTDIHGEIDKLWKLFQVVLAYADANPATEELKNYFTNIYDQTLMEIKFVTWGFTVGFYWVRPNSYLNLDSTNRGFILQADSNQLGSLAAKIKKLPDGETYLAITAEAKKIIEHGNEAYKSFPALSVAAWEKKGIASWIFQSNPAYYDIEKAVQELKTITFLVKQHKKEIKKGNRVYVWESGPTGGILAKGIILCNPVIKPTNKADPYDKSFLENMGAQYLAVDISLDEKIPAQKITREVLLSDERTKNMELLGFAAATNFSLTEDEADVIDSLIDGSYKQVPVEKVVREKGDGDSAGGNTTTPASQIDPYNSSKFLQEVYMAKSDYEELEGLLQTKKNIILQGPPGVGKTFAAKRLAYSIIGRIDASLVKFVQFHQSYSYEDFIKGYRPNSNGGFDLKTGPFYDFCLDVIRDNQGKDQVYIESHKHFFIIDEINRGNLSKIFGELLMLIEADKRGPEFAMRTMYDQAGDTAFYVPENVYIIGMMNTADRSLAIMDYALRRRFAFFTMEPAFENEQFKAYYGLNTGEDSAFKRLIKAVVTLNQNIAQDTENGLGEGFRIGHSYFCLTPEAVKDVDRLKRIINYEIKPLLTEYYIEKPEKIEQETGKLLQVLE